MNSLFVQVKSQVTTRQAAERYGVPIGHSGMARCIFHDDRHPSMKVDERFYCFGCHATGDVIDFTAKLFGLTAYEAAQKLALDFHIDPDQPPSAAVLALEKEKQRRRQRDQWIAQAVRELGTLSDEIEQRCAALLPQTPDAAWDPALKQLFRSQNWIHHLQEEALARTEEEREQFYETYHDEIVRLTQRENDQGGMRYVPGCA